MTTMSEMYGDKSDSNHEACDKCGMCIHCGDCKCNGNIFKLLMDNKEELDKADNNVDLYGNAFIFISNDGTVKTLENNEVRILSCKT